MTGLWSGITATVGQAIDWIVGKIGWVMNAGKQVGDWFGSLFGGEKQAAPTSTAPTSSRPAALASATSLTVPRPWSARHPRRGDADASGQSGSPKHPGRWQCPFNRWLTATPVCCCRPRSRSTPHPEDVRERLLRSSIHACVR